MKSITNAIAALLMAVSAPASLAVEPTLSKPELSANSTEVRFRTSAGVLTLHPLTECAIRVRFSDGKTAAFPSFVQTGRPPMPKFSVRETEKEIVVATAKIRAVVDRASGRVRFCDASGKQFLSEKPGTRVLEPKAVQGEPSFAVGQGFELAPGEHLFGLGQFQDGLWDWRGLPLELRQLNTQISVPVLISSEGYGLLWDNASRTDFNLPGEPVALVAENPSTDAAANGPTATEQLAANSKAKKQATIWKGTFTSGDAGEYAFCTRDGDRREEIAILVDGWQIAGVKNMWVPRAAIGKISLPAHKTCEVTVRGGGEKVKLFAGPVTGSTTFRSDCGEAVDYMVFYGLKLDDVIAGYRDVTGAAPLWPKWAYGFWQCRERYSSQQQILDTAAEFRRRQIPMDLIVQDWQYWGKHGWGSYEWDETNYPAPADLIKGLHELNVKFMISVWCNPNGKTREELNQNKMSAGSWIDVFDPKGREIRWKHLNESLFSIGTDAWWGDATEPGDPGTDLLGRKISIGLGDRFTSAYPLFASQSLYEGQRAADPNKRVCILTRSAFPGQQRYAAGAWSGDINGNWETFKRQIPAGLNYCLTGLPYWTTDCGGFFHPRDQYKSADYNELLARWFQWSTFCPILRIHGYQTQTEMWNWLPATQKILLDYDRLRYRMLPYNYSVAWKVTSEAYTIMRALGMDFPKDQQAWNISDEYMFGPAMLVTPIAQPGVSERPVYLPEWPGGWYDFWTGEHRTGGRTVKVAAPIEQIPLHVRAGSIIPMGPAMQWADEKKPDPLELRIYPGANGTFTLYEDEGDNYNYEQGKFSTIPLTWDDKVRTLTIGPRIGKFPGMLERRTFRVVLVAPNHGVGIEQADGNVREVACDGHEIREQF